MLMSLVEEYLAVRRTLGYKLETTESKLKSYARYAKLQGDSFVISATAVEWARQTTSIRQSARRLGIVRSFARYLNAEDTRHEIPPDDFFCAKATRPTPYIFSEAELLCIVGEARKLEPDSTLRSQTFGTLFGLLSVTGLRISEALALHISDVTTDGLIVRDTKFGKTRLVPLHDTTQAAVQAYLVHRLEIRTDNDALFLHRRHGPLGYVTTRLMFRKLCLRAKVPWQPHPRPLRMHDIRHTVAVRMLTNCPHVRDQVTPHMLALSTYLGHASLRGTYWYLQATPQLMQDITNAGEAWMAGETQ